MAQRDDRSRTREPRLPGSRLLGQGLRGGALGLLVAAIGWSLLGPLAASRETAVKLPPPLVDPPSAAAADSETAVLAGGCFWGVQAVFQHLNGVRQAVSGYSGGSKETALYPVVSAGGTGHAESVEVSFDPKVVSYGTILQIFFSVAHNPTELDRQGPDIGSQYRSVVFARDARQRQIAEAYIAQLDKAGSFAQPIVTKIVDFDAFYPAEAYHQDYATAHPENPYIAFNDLPKIADLKRLFPALNRDKPVLVSSRPGS